MSEGSPKRGWKNPEKGPRCPGCGYPIFGLKDMRCPECGRTLDVRDFTIPDEEGAAYRRGLKRSGIIGGLIAIVAVLIFTLAIFALNAVTMSNGFILRSGVVMLVFCLMTLFGVIWSVQKDV